MKKILLAFAMLLSWFVSNSQTFSDDFESYAVGAMLAATSPDWETWTSATGGSDDSPVTDANAHSGTRSVYFASTLAAGGPQDCVLNFPDELNTGQFNFEMWLYVDPAGTGAYFNFQQEDAIGTTWAADVYFLDGGIAQFTSGGTLLLAPSYPEGEWFKLRMENDLSTNTWEIFINDVSQGSYANTSTQIASIDIFPLLNNKFYIDDVSYEYVPYTLPALNAAVTSINNFTSGLSGQTISPSVIVRNLGTTTINSFDLTLSYNGNTATETISGVNIASLAFYTVPFSDDMILAAGSNDVTATISNVNGAISDDNAPDDIKVLNVNPIVPAPGKKVVAEEATGTWCPWCVRGAVFMEDLSERYDELYVGIAVHNADPMTVESYDSAIGGLISGYPSGLVDRIATYDPSQFEAPFLTQVQIAPKAFIENGATWNSTTRELNISATTTFQQTVTGNYKIAFVLTEDDVTGTGSTWAQNNAYAGGGNGDMGGFETLPNPVPANQMVYDHVARALAPSFAGLSGAFTGMQDMGDVTTHNFSIVLPAGWDENNVHIIAMVIAPDGKIDNAASVSIEEAVDNGYVAGALVTDVTEPFAPDTKFNIYPNPANEQCFMNVDFQHATEFTIDIYSADGRLVASKDYGTLNGAMLLPINTATWEAGLYKVKITSDNNVLVKTVVKQ